MEIFVEYPRHEMRHYYGKRKLNLKCNHMAYVFVTQTVISIHCLVTFLSKRFHYGLFNVRSLHNSTSHTACHIIIFRQVLANAMQCNCVVTFKFD